MVAATSPALYLLALACPVSMVVMMVWMMKGMAMGGKKVDEQSDGARGESSLAALKAEQARLAEKIEELEVRSREVRSREPAEEGDRTAV